MEREQDCESIDAVKCYIFAINYEFAGNSYFRLDQLAMGEL